MDDIIITFGGEDIENSLPDPDEEYIYSQLPLMAHPPIQGNLCTISTLVTKPGVYPPGFGDRSLSKSSMYSLDTEMYHAMALSSSVSLSPD